MHFDWTVILYVVFLVDSIAAVLMSWFGRKWWLMHASSVAKFFPPAKGWTLLYFVLVLVIGHLLGIL